MPIPLSNPAVATAVVPSVLRAGRRAAESRMTSRVTIHREDPENPTTDDRGLEVAGYVAVAIDVPCRFPPDRGSGRSRTLSRGDSEVEVASRRIDLPALFDDLLDNDVCVVTVGRLVGRTFQVVDATPADDATAYRVPIVEIDKPGGIS